jgi:hypothetical protein
LNSYWRRKKVWGTFTNSCVLCMKVVQWIGAPLDAGFRELRLQEVEKRDSCNEDMATWTRNELVQGKHACSCFGLAEARRRRWRLCGKITCVKETSSYTVREFHTFWVNSFQEKYVGPYFLSNPLTSLVRPSVDIFLQAALYDRTSLHNWVFLHDLCRVVCEWPLFFAHEAVLLYFVLKMRSCTFSEQVEVVFCLR